MKKYEITVEVIETYHYTVEVEAENQQDAGLRARMTCRDDYRKSEFIEGRVGKIVKKQKID
jgi:hypothetical protein